MKANPRHFAKKQTSLGHALTLALMAGALFATEGRGAIPQKDPTCLVDASLSAVPSTVDREAEGGPYTALSWLVKPRNCSGEINVSLAGQPIHDWEGVVYPMVTKTRRFDLKISVQDGMVKPITKSVTVNAVNDPGIIEVSDGSVITDQDIDEFDKQWMQPWFRAGALGELDSYLYNRSFWWGSERMEAMIRMYDLKPKKSYVEYLLALNEKALQYRDDRHPGPRADDRRPPHRLPEAMPQDVFRGNVVLPAWGGRSVASGDYHGVSEMAFAFIHSFAGFGRIVAENPELQQQFGNKAIAFTNEAIKAARIFLPQLSTRVVNGRKESTLKTLDGRGVMTRERCDWAYQRAVQEVDANADLSSSDKAAQKKTLASLNKDCHNGLREDGFVMAHNWNQWFMMGLIELWRAMDSTYYRASTQADPEAARLRHELPLIVSRMNSFFINRMRVEHDEWSNQRVLVWNYNDELPSYIKTYIEDTGHGSLDLRGLDVLRSNLTGLNQVAAAFGEPIEWSNEYLRMLTNTFLYRIAGTSNGNLADNMAKHYRINPTDGKPILQYSPGVANNTACDGWINFAEFDANVYHKCKDVTLKVVSGKQPYLTIGAHSALLKNKHWLEPAPAPEPVPVPQPEPTPQPVPDPIPADDICVLKPWSPGCADGNPRSEQ